MSKLRSGLYGAARLLGDVEAATKGPGPFVRRRARAFGLAKWNGLFRRIFKV
jgi:hypothetical protein